MEHLVSVIVPCLNEEDSLRLLYEGVCEHMPCPFEIVFVDDGSTDGSLRVIKALRSEDDRVHFIAFRKNFGKAAALQAAFRNCRGDIVITMDADLQDDPRELPHFIEKIDEGYDLISGWKFHRNDPLEKRLPSKLFNRVVSQMSGVHLHDFNCGYKAYRQEVVNSLDLYGELHRFVPVLASRKGFTISEIKVQHNARKFGRSKYGLERYFRGLFDALTVGFLSRYYDRPMHFFGKIGTVSGVVGFLICFLLLIQWLMGASLSERPLLQLGILLIILGVQLFSIGLLGDMIIANFFRSRYDESHIREKE
ncbi:glycosyltransferase family 2 protein [Ruminococcaceae bacterium OttesenSCG-928-I18]|nr:glycosyltransferase family 2 protein [Ruminococcaceae bacterium OttesenSCG-928-I18]